MPTTKCWSTVRSCCARFTRVDGCGNPVYGASSQVVTKGHISIAYAPSIVEGDKIEVKNACGEVCVTDKACDSIQWFDVTGTFCKVDPDLFSLLTGQPRVLDIDGNPVGVRIGSKVNCSTGFAAETWTQIPGQSCASGVAGQWGYFLLPFNDSGVIQDFTIQNGEINFSIKWRAKNGSSWGNGPYDVDDNGLLAVTTPGPLITPIGADDFLDMHLTTIAPPCDADGAVLCGFQTLVAPG